MGIGYWVYHKTCMGEQAKKGKKKEKNETKNA
jgi:hypothetical protein